VKERSRPSHIDFDKSRVARDPQSGILVGNRNMPKEQVSVSKRRTTLVYLSMANIPSKSANSIQTMKMAEAMAQVYQPFILITSGFVWVKGRNKVCLRDWYGVKKLPKILRIPSSLLGAYPFKLNSKPSAMFLAICFFYLIVRRDYLVYTRAESLLRWCSVFRIPLVFEAHLEPNLSDDQLRKFIEGNAALKGVVAISPRLAKTYKKYLPESRVLHLEDGVDPTLYDGLPGKEELRNELGIDVHSYSRLAVFTGHLYPDRGIETIIAAAAELPKVFFLLIGGWHQDVEAWEGRAEKQSITNIQFRGFRPHSEIPRYQKAADILLMPYSSSLNIAKIFSSLKLFEYMASGTPIIASNLPRVCEVLPGDQGYLIKPDDVSGLTKAVGAIDSDYDEALERARRARIAVVQYSWQSRARHIVKTFLNS
jgi:glycosyltransferase involved in cell wall biosynthesis